MCIHKKKNYIYTRSAKVEETIPGADRGKKVLAVVAVNTAILIVTEEVPENLAVRIKHDLKMNKPSPKAIFLKKPMTSKASNEVNYKPIVIPIANIISN